MNELKISVNSSVGTITTNFEDLKDQLRVQMKVYKELSVTSDNKAERKKDVATLRKMQKAVSGEYSSVRKEFLKPLDDLKAAVDDLNGIIEEPIKLLDNQIKEFEDQQRLEKKHEIEAYLSAAIGDLDLDLDQIYDSKWENATASMKSVKTDIDNKIQEIRNNVTLIKSMNSEKSEQALDMYLTDFDVAKAITFINKFEQQKREIEERIQRDQEAKRQQELEAERQRVREEERKRIQEEETIRQQERERIEQEQQSQKEAMTVQRTVSGVKQKYYEIHASEEEFAQLEMYMNSLGLYFMVVKRG